MNAADRTTARKSNGRLDRALMLAIFAVVGGLFWQMFSMNERHSRDIAELNVNIAELGERHSGDIAELNVNIAELGERHSREIAALGERQSRNMAELNASLSSDVAELSERIARIETLLQYIVPHIVPNPADLSPDAEL